MVGIKRSELSILLAYPSFTEGNTMVLTDNVICYQSCPLSGQDLIFKYLYTHVSGHHFIARDVTWVN